MKLVLTSLTCAALFLTGCANMSETQQGTAKGAGIGAVAGAVLGAATGGSKGAATGAVLGGAVGAGGGYLWSQAHAGPESRHGTGHRRHRRGRDARPPTTASSWTFPSDISFATGRSDVKHQLRAAS